MDKARKRVEGTESESVNEQAESVQSAADADDADATHPAKMKVRVVLRSDQAPAAKPTAAPQARQEPVYYEYRKDRIFLAVLSGVLILIGIGFFGYRLVTLENEPAPLERVGQEVDRAQTVDVPLPAPIEPDQAPATRDLPPNADERLVSARDKAQSPSEGGTSEGSKSDSVRPDGAKPVGEPVAERRLEGISSGVQSQSAKAHDRMASDLKRNGGAPNSGNTQSRDAMVSGASSKQPANAASANGSPTGRGEYKVSSDLASVATKPQVKVLSDAIARASLNWRVTDLEPGREVVKNPIVFESGEAIKQVYFYTQLDDKKDNIFYYEWFLDGRPMAKVKVGVWSNRWRSYSSKQILRKHLGQWSVKFTDEAGTVYAQAAFKVTASEG